MKNIGFAVRWRGTVVERSKGFEDRLGDWYIARRLR